MPRENEAPEEGQETETPEVDEQGLLEAVGSAIDEVTIVEEVEGDGEGDESEGDGEGDESEGDGEGDESEGDESEGDGEGDESEGDGEGDESEGDGEGDESEGDGEGDESEGDGEGDDDPINDPIPDSTAEPTRKRIQSLIDIARARTTEAAQGQEIVGAITDAGADPEQFANTVTFLKLYNSDSQQDREVALRVAQGVVRELSLELGRGAEVVDLTQHADLTAEVEAGTLTEERALEIAAGRDRDALQQSRTEHNQQQQNSQAQTTKLVQDGRDALNTLEQTLEAADPDYKARRPAFIKLLGPVLRRIHPTEWTAVAKEVYENLKTFSPAAQPKPEPKPRKRTPQPLRPKEGSSGGSGGKQTEPQSAEEAVSRAIDAL